MNLDKATKTGLILVLLVSPFGQMLNLSKEGYLFTIPKMLMLLVVSLWIWRGLFSKNARMLTLPFSNSIFICLWILILANLLSFLGAQYLGSSIKEMIRLLSQMVFIILIADLLEERIWLKRGITAILIAAMLSLGFGIYEMISKKSALQLVGEENYLHSRTMTGEQVSKKSEVWMPEDVGAGNVAIRVQGPHDDPDIFALYLTAIMGIALCELVARKSVKAKAFMLALIGLMALEMIYTSSRTGLISLVATIFFFLLVAPYRKKGLVVFLMFPLALLFPFILLNIGELLPSVYGVFHLTSLQDIGKDPRINSWMTGVKMITIHPIIGVGLGNFKDVYLRYRETTAVQTPVPVQNIFIQMWAEGGILTLAAFITFLLVLTRKLVKCLLTSPDRYFRIMAAGILSVIVGMFPLLLSQENVWEQEFLWMLFGLAATICAAPTGLSEPSRQGYAQATVR